MLPKKKIERLPDHISIQEVNLDKLCTKGRGHSLLCKLLNNQTNETCSRQVVLYEIKRKLPGFEFNRN